MHGPAGLPSSARVQRRDSLNNPLVGFSSPSRPIPSHSATGISAGSTSLGVLVPLQRFRRRESTSARSSCDARSGFPGVTRVVCRRVPPRRLRCRSQVFPTSQRLLPLPNVPPFSDGLRSWGLPYRGLFFKRSLDDSSPPTYPRDVPPADCATPVLGGGIRGRSGRCLGCSNQNLYSSSGFQASRESVRVITTV